MSAMLRNKDFLAGFLFIAAGAAFLWLSRDYDLGSTRRMGPGYFPNLLSILLMLIGGGVLLSSFKSQEKISGFAYRGFASVIVGTVVFGALIRDAGILVAVALLILISALGNPRSRWLPICGLAVVMAVFSYAVFVKALGLPIPVFGYWFSN